MSRIDDILSLVDQVPPFPKVARQVMKMLENENIKVRDLADVIQYDATITANILKTCNAAYYGLSRKVTSIEDALVVLGQQALKDIIITSSSVGFYKGKAGAGYLLEEGDLWKHAVAAAIMAQLLSPQFAGVDKGAAFTAGLLHDIGKRFISGFVGEELKKIVSYAHGEKSSFIEAEKGVIGISHAEFGALILERWDFDEEMVKAVRMHHNPLALEEGGLVALVALSNTLVISMGVGVGADGLAAPMEGESLGRFGITHELLEKAMSELWFELEKAEEMINLVK
jgi:putative nucleotidyltransferase with HDIG domain